MSFSGILLLRGLSTAVRLIAFAAANRPTAVFVANSCARMAVMSLDDLKTKRKTQEIRAVYA